MNSAAIILQNIVITRHDKNRLRNAVATLTDHPFFNSRLFIYYNYQDYLQNGFSNQEALERTLLDVVEQEAANDKDFNTLSRYEKALRVAKNTPMPWTMKYRETIISLLLGLGVVLVVIGAILLYS